MKAKLCSLLLAMPAFAAEPATTAVNQLGLDLHRQLAQAKPDANLCFSPYSIQTALAMTYAGAEGQTREEMAKVLHYPAGDAIHDALPALTQALNAASAKTEKLVEDSKRYGGGGEPVTLTVANRLFGHQGYRFLAPFLKTLETAYQAPLEAVDFTAAETARKRINRWVEEKTKDRIKDLLSPMTINESTRLVLVNAIYLKAPWSDRFTVGATKPEPFHLAGGKEVTVPTMTAQRKYGYAKREGYTAVTLPYFGGDLHFLVLVPDEVNGLPSLEKKLTAEALAENARLERREIRLFLPKFKIEGSSVSLSENLQALGMKRAFDQPRGSADFSRMTAPGPDSLYISEVVHQAFIALDEKGTEAAAATAVVMAPRGAMPGPPDQPVEVRVDRPFLFAIQHRDSGACLFLGRVTNPK